MALDTITTRVTKAHCFCREEMKPTYERLVPTLLITLMTLSACASVAPIDTEEEQQQALLRWNRCLERNIGEMPEGFVDGSESLERACDGHKRDVLMTYPPRMEKALDSYLVQRTRERAVKHMAIESVERHSSLETPAVVQAVIAQ